MRSHCGRARCADARRTAPAGNATSTATTKIYYPARRADSAAAAADALRIPASHVHPTPLAQAAAQAAERILAERPRVSAVLCLNDTAALGVLSGLDAAGVRVPTDMSVVGYDDLQFAARLSPALTTIAQPSYRLGCTAADLLLDEARPGHAHREIVFRPSLVVRASNPRAGQRHAA